MKKEPGYIAIASVLVIAVIAIIIGVSTSLTSINNIQAALSQSKGGKVMAVLDACVEEALLKLNNTASLPSTVTIPEGSCSVTINNQSGSNWTFTVLTTIDSYTKSAQVTAGRTTTVSVNTWLEQ